MLWGQVYSYLFWYLKRQTRDMFLSVRDEVNYVTCHHWLDDDLLKSVRRIKLRKFATSRGYRFQSQGNFCWWNPESCALDSGTQLKGSGIPLTNGIQNPRLFWILSLESRKCRATVPIICSITSRCLENVPALLLSRSIVQIYENTFRLVSFTLWHFYLFPS